MEPIAVRKAELQARGVRIPLELIGELEKDYNFPAIRTGRMVLCLPSPAGDGELIPAFIVNGKRGETSPLHLVRTGGGEYEVWWDSKKFTDIILLPRPRFYDTVTGSGLAGQKLAVIVGPGHLRSVVNQRCYYHRINQGCRFCAVQHWWDASIEKASAEIAEVALAGVAEGAVQHISLTTATLNTPGKGLEDLVHTAALIHRRDDVPIMLEFEPVEDPTLLGELLREAREAGVTTVSCNIECFDESLREEIMPAKGKVPVSVYQKTWEICLDVFGGNEVFTTAVAGIGEDDDSIVKGIAMAASLGVMTFLVPHSPATGAVYQDMEAPTAARMLSLYERAAAIYRQHGLDLYACRSGCVRGGGFSAIKEVARFGKNTDV